MTRTRRTKTEVAAPANQNSLINFVLGVVLGFAVGVFYSQPSVAPTPRPDDGKGQVLPDDGKQVVKAQGFIYFVHDRQSMTVDELQLLDATDAFCKQNKGLEVRSVDMWDEAEAAMKVKKLGESQKVSPPYVLFRSNEGKVKALEKPANLDDVKKVLK